MQAKLLTGTLVMFVSLVVLTSGVALAAPGGKGGGGGHGGGGKGGGNTAPPATLSVSAPVQAYSSFGIDGCGYVVAEGVGVKFILYQASGTAVWADLITPDGCIAETAEGWANGPGQATLEAWQPVKGKFTLMGKITFSIE